MSIFQRHSDDASSFIESFTPAELGRLLELKLDKWKIRTADESAYWDAKSAENKFIKDMAIKHGRELSGISVLFLTITVVECVLARKLRDERIAAVLGPD